MIRIAILDNEQGNLEKEFKLTTKFFKEKGQECEIITYGKTEWLFFDLTERSYDAYLIEAKMPDKSAAEIVGKIRKEDSESVIIFISGSENAEEALETYELGIFRYIVRSELEEKLYRCCESLLQIIEQRKNSIYVIEKRGKIEKIPYKEIFYLRKEGKYVVITHRKGESRVRKTLEEVQKELKSDDFLRVEKGYIVNLNHAEKMENNELLMDNEEVIRVGKKRAAHVKDTLFVCWTRDKACRSQRGNL